MHHRLRLITFPMRARLFLVLARGEISRFPRKELTHMLGSTTAPGRPGARVGAPARVAFHSTHSVGVPRVLFSRLNTQPMRTPVNASPKPSRVSAHDSGTVWFATPSLAETCTLYSLPVSRRTRCQVKQLPREIRPAVTVGNPGDPCTGCNRSWYPKRKLDNTGRGPRGRR